MEHLKLRTNRQCHVAAASTKRVRAKVALLMCMLVLLPGCAKPEPSSLKLHLDQDSGRLEVEIFNRSNSGLLVGDHLHGLVNRADEDLMIVVDAEDGKRITQCRSHDYFSPEKELKVPPNQSIVLATHVGVVANTHCLDTPGTYRVSARIGPGDRSGLRDEIVSNAVDYEVSARDIERRTIPRSKSRGGRN